MSPNTWPDRARHHPILEAKPKVREQALVAIQDGGLDRLLDVLR